MKGLNHDVMVNGAGAGVGVVWTVISKNYIDNNMGPIPFISDYLPHPWGYWSTTGSIIIGGVLFGLSQFSNLIRNRDLNSFLTYFGITTLIGGVMNGILYPASARASGRTFRLAPRINRANASMSPLTPTGVPAAKVLA